jgi:micrococcal nuclease
LCDKPRWTRAIKHIYCTPAFWLSPDQRISLTDRTSPGTLYVRNTAGEEQSGKTVRAMERKPVLGMLIMMALALGCPPNSIQEAAADSFVFKAVVVGVDDGDTLTVRRNKARFTMNVAAVDAPELDQPYGQEAKRMAAALVKNQVVTIRVYGTERKGRLTGEVWFRDKRNLARELVKAGLAWVKPGAVVAAELTLLEANAKEVRRGIWANEEPVAPWEWRAGRRPIGVGATP